MKTADDIDRKKAEIRNRIWSEMEETNVARFPRPVFGRIPNFDGAESAARKLGELVVFREAKVVFCCPDSPQRWVRLLILNERKVLVVASPRLRKGLILLDPTEIDSKDYGDASTIAGAFRFGKLVKPFGLKIDLKVTGSVAVSLEGGRVGKGGGYSDLEYGILRQFNCVTDGTPIATSVHDMQVVDWVPMDPAHDMPIDLITTPTRVVETKTRIPKPKGIDWNLLSEKQVREIPLLGCLRRHAV